MIYSFRKTLSRQVNKEKLPPDRQLGRRPPFCLPLGDVLSVSWIWRRNQDIESWKVCRVRFVMYVTLKSGVTRKDLRSLYLTVVCLQVYQSMFFQPTLPARTMVCMALWQNNFAGPTIYPIMYPK